MLRIRMQIDFDGGVRATTRVNLRRERVRGEWEAESEREVAIEISAYSKIPKLLQPVEKFMGISAAEHLLLFCLYLFSPLFHEIC